MQKHVNTSQQNVSGLGGLGNRFLVDLEKGKPTIQMQKALDVISLLGLEIVIRRKGS
jgi:hypothetical protein